MASKLLNPAHLPNVMWCILEDHMDLPITSHAFPGHILQHVDRPPLEHLTVGHTCCNITHGSQWTPWQSPPDLFCPTHCMQLLQL
jgi:hypothetical protein